MLLKNDWRKEEMSKVSLILILATFYLTGINSSSSESDITRGFFLFLLLPSAPPPPGDLPLPKKFLISGMIFHSMPRYTMKLFEKYGQKPKQKPRPSTRRRAEKSVAPSTKVHFKRLDLRFLEIQELRVILTKRDPEFPGISGQVV
eukprot:sb/3473827/